jgi:hypothetical protein
MTSTSISPTSTSSSVTLSSWLSHLFTVAKTNLPKVWATIALQIGIVLAVQVVFWWDGINPYLPTFISGPIIFLTATYNDVLPKTIYWIIVFTFGKRLLAKIQLVGFKKAFDPIKAVIPDVKRAVNALGQKALAYGLLGAGLGLIIANNFASYSRFAAYGAVNKMDKYFIAVVISFTLSYFMGEGKKHWIFTFSRLSYQALAKRFTWTTPYTDAHTLVLLSGFVGGLLADFPLIVIGWQTGGYLVGTVGLIAGIVLLLQKKGQPA